MLLSFSTSLFAPQKKKKSLFYFDYKGIFVETSDKQIRVVGLHMYGASAKKAKSMFNHK